ncbi:olfactory receptor class A-like protein 1 [Tachyglossus aculeatus]|uniref:olfactory receptor class A-like protein 1 n=1 Tax=Tachyglossus aculeatus TaxID=9261 RepID=UPI0018F75BFE|nr:olfactory receptor class A-like protein 1 [Tachyglossus aculeatus]
MNATELPFGILLLLQITIGILVNVFLLPFYVHLGSTTHKLNSPDPILAQLSLANTIILLTFGIRETMSAWGLRKFLDDVGCIILPYLYQVSRSLAICSTCLLSIFQAVTISPSTSWWAGVKAKLPKCIIPSCVLSWILNMLMEFDIVMNLTSPQKGRDVRIILDLKYCTSVSEDTPLIISIVHSFRDLFFVGLMTVESGYMVFVLRRHQRLFWHLHGPGHYPRAMTEVRVVKRVIALVTLYVLFYGRQSIMLSTIMNMKENSPLLVNAHMALGFTFSVISPFLILHSDRRMRAFWIRESLVFHMAS